MKRLLLLFIIFQCAFLTLSTAQGLGLEVDVQAGTHTAGVNYHHPSPVTENTGEDGSIEKGNINFQLGLAAKVYKGIHLRTELGYAKTNYFMDIDYTLAGLFTSSPRGRTTWFTNQRLYLAVLPEYRIVSGPVSFRAFAGPLISGDVSNTLTNPESTLLPSGNPLGLKAGVGGIVMVDKVGLTGNLSYLGIGKSTVFSSADPQISYRQVQVSVGILYVL